MEELFSKLDVPEPPEGLTERVLARIDQRERRILRAKIVASAMAFAISLGGAIEGYLSLAASLSHSGFFEITSLAFSDFSSVAANLPDFIFSIAESFPVFTTALFLSGVLFAIWSMAALIDETTRISAGVFPSAKQLS